MPGVDTSQRNGALYEAICSGPEGRIRMFGRTVGSEIRAVCVVCQGTVECG